MVREHACNAFWDRVVNVAGQHSCTFPITQQWITNKPSATFSASVAAQSGSALNEVDTYKSK